MKWIKLERGIHMGKVSYRPKRNQGRNEVKRQQDIKSELVDMPIANEEPMKQSSSKFQDTVQDEIQNEIPKISVATNRKNQHKLESIKVIGDLECEYHIYIEDYVYTYLYQLAAADLAKESSAMLIGEIFSDSKEAIIRGVIPVDMDKLEEGAEWIDISIAEEIENQRKSYFGNQDIIGWMHMQPGYGTMLTMKELREHQSVFEGNGTICMLVDAINKIETVFVYEDEELKEQSGYCMYYERNEEMQQFMLDHPFSAGTKEEMKDTVVNQFREIGKIRKAEYTQRKNLNLTVMAASVILIILTAVIVKMNENKTYVNANANQTDVMAESNLTEGDYLGESENTFLTNPASEQVSNDAVGVEQQDVDTTKGDKVLAAGEESSLENQEVKADGEDTSKQQVEEKTNEEKESNPVKQDIAAGNEEEYITYTVQTGDTLANICYKQYGSAEKSLEVAKLNGLSSTNQIYVGQELKMPK